jgi:tetratricopeptide (TPR) repeat protein
MSAMIGTPPPVPREASGGVAVPRESRDAGSAAPPPIPREATRDNPRVDHRAEPRTDREVAAVPVPVARDSSAATSVGVTPREPAAAVAPTVTAPTTILASDDDSLGEATRPVPTPNAAALVDEIVELVSYEAEALLTGGNGSPDPDADERLADLNVRLSLITWDVLEDADDSARYLELAEKHPLAPRLLLSHAIAIGTPVALDAAEAAIARVTDARDRHSLYRDVAEAWLYRLGDPRRAAAAAARVLEPGAEADLVVDARHVLAIAWAASDDIDALVTAAIETAGHAGTAPDELADAIAIVLDRRNDAAGALELAIAALLRNERTIERARGSATALQWLRLADLAVDAATIARDPRLPELLERRIAILDGDTGAARESAAGRYLAAADRLRRGDAAAGDILARLATLEGESTGFGPRLARLTALDAAVTHGRWRDAALLRRDLAREPGGGGLAAAHLWRGYEVADARAHDPGLALELLRAAHALARTTGSARALERALLAGDPGELVAHIEAHADPGKGHARRAAAVIESRVGDGPRAVRLLRALVEDRAHAATRLSEHEHLARLHRRDRDRARLSEAYRAMAAAHRDRRVAAALLTAAGAVELSRGKPVEAEEAFAAAARQSPRDPACRAALAALYRKAQRWRDLAGTLGELSAMVQHPQTRVALLREYASVLSEHLADPRRARTVLEQALALAPDDPPALHELAKLYDQARQWDKSIELRQRAVELYGDARAQAALLLEIGHIEEGKRNDETAALAAYDRAYRTDSTVIDALRAQQQLHRRARRGDRLLETLREELDRGVDAPRRLQVQLEVARLVQDVGGDVDSGLAAYLDVLTIESDNAAALGGVERIARGSGRWAELARAFRGAPKTPSNLRTLGEALERLGDWPELAEVRQAEIDASPTPADKARLATQLASIYEQKLGDVDAAVRMHQLALTAGVPVDASQRELARLLEQTQRWPELATTLERELTTMPAAAVDRQIAVLLRLGELRRDKLGKPADAALAYESVLERAAGHVPALIALEELYDRLGREKDLLRVLEARAEATLDKLERAQLYTRIAGVRQNRSDVDGAIAAYIAAFTADPTNRDTFTAMEKLCYKHERWPAAMQLYQTAIDMVEAGQVRAYRLGDLYARRGQVQLQYLGELDSAATSYLRVVELDPENDTSVKYLESIYSQKNEWSGLIKAYEKRAELTRDDERRLDTLRRAARVAGAKLKDSAEAARIYAHILEVDASDLEALDALERFHERNQDWAQLVDVLRLRLNTAPAGDAAVALLKRIANICEEGLRDEAKAVEHYLRILEIAPGNKEALEALGRIYESTEQWAEFIDVTRRQIRVTTDRNLKALLYFKCGSVMEAKFGKEEDAIRYYDAAIKTSPSCLPAVHGLRDLYRRREDWPRVIQTLELEVKLWQDDKERAGVFAQIGRIYEQRLGAPDRAMHYYESALAVDPECLPANQSLFEHYFLAGDWTRAQPLAQALAQKAMREGDPTTRSDFYRKRGIVAQMTGDARSAAESLIIALEIKPTNLDALDALGELSRRHPDAYDFEATYRELDKIYKKRDDAGPYLARARVAQAAQKEREGDLDTVERLYAEANLLAPSDFAVLSALVDFHANMRRWSHAVDAIVRFLESSVPPSPEIRLAALMRQAEIHADCEMDPHRAISVLREVLRLEPTHQDAHYRIAQEYYLLGRFSDARQAIERVIELASAPGASLSPQYLARSYYYKGRILEAAGDPRAATSQFRRAIEYDPGYAPPALALARRAAEAGDQRQAETLLIDAAHAAMEQGGPTAAVPLQRGLARILLSSGDRPAAIEAYRGILNVDPDNAADRVALAEIYAIDDVPRAIAELRKVVDRDIHHAPAYRLLSSLYGRGGETDRSARALTVIEQLGFAEEDDRGAAQKARSAVPHVPLRRGLDDELRLRMLATQAARDPMGEVFAACASEISALFAQPALGENLVPIQTVEDAALRVAVADVTRLYGTDAEIYIGERVPGMAVVIAFPRRLIVIDRVLLDEPDAARRYLLGWAHEALRGGYALLLHLGARQRVELGSLLRSLLLPEGERAGPTNDFVRALPKRAAKIIERHVGRGREADTDAWLEGMLACAKRGGLLASDDFAAATWMIARLSGENLPDHQATVALGAVLGGADLVRFYLSDDYHRLREYLATPSPQGAA